MENSEISNIFWEMAELLTLSNENRFKIRAYERAAQNIEGLSDNLENIYRSGHLKDIPGIGEGIAKKIIQFIETGKIAEHQKYLKIFPKETLDMLRIPGIGPRSAVIFQKKLKIKNIDQLEAAIKAGIINDIPGYGEKKLNNILAGIAQYRSHQGRFLLDEASSYADSIISALKKIPSIKNISPAGSLRRMKETIGDIDILVISKEYKKIMQVFTNLPQVKRIIAKGHTKSSVVLKNDMNCDLRILEPGTYGAALHYFTGSRSHNIKIRELGIKKGLKVSEYGIFKKDKVIAGKTETEVYAAVNLPYIPPELREDRGELEAATAHKLPKLVELHDIIGDLHIHSRYSDGSNTIAEIAKYAQELGYAYIAITDHSISTRIAGGLDEKKLLAHNREIEKLNLKIKLLKGVEVDILPDGSLDYADNILKTCDVVIAAVHSKFNMDKKSITERIIKAMKNKYVNILAHPTGRLLNERSAYEVDLEKILQTAKDTGTFIELNSHPKRLDLDDIHCKRAKKLGILISVNTDAHTLDQLHNMKYGIATARRGWLEKKNILNTLPFDQLLKKLHQKR
ncbi:MAG: DNA polymerase/3'-5' exonuclease PolX [bacterium]